MISIVSLCSGKTSSLESLRENNEVYEYDFGVNKKFQGRQLRSIEEIFETTFRLRSDDESSVAVVTQDLDISQRAAARPTISSKDGETVGSLCRSLRCRLSAVKIDGLVLVISRRQLGRSSTFSAGLSLRTQSLVLSPASLESPSGAFTVAYQDHTPVTHPQPRSVGCGLLAQLIYPSTFT